MNLIDFEVEGFDMGKFIVKDEERGEILYDLFGVSNHYGSLVGGHYTAFCKNHFTNKWYEFDDSSVHLIKDQQNVVTKAAYFLCYRKRKLEKKKKNKK